MSSVSHQKQREDASLVQVSSSAVAGVSDGGGSISTVHSRSVGVGTVDSCAPVEAGVGVGGGDVLGRSHSDEGKANEELKKRRYC